MRCPGNETKSTWTKKGEGYGRIVYEMSTTDVEEHVLRNYEIRRRIGKGVSDKHAA